MVNYRQNCVHIDCVCNQPFFLLRGKGVSMFFCLRKKVPWFGTAITVLALLAGLSLIACSQPDDPVSSLPVDAATPNITAHPQSGTFNVMTQNTHDLSVTATRSDGGTLSYQWYANTSNSSTGGTAVGTNSATLTLDKDDYDERGTYFYYVVVTNTNNNATGKKTAASTSNAATVTVSGNGSAPAFTVPANLQGSWRVVDSPGEEYTITETMFSYGDDYYGYTGTIVNHRAIGASSGYLTIEYTANSFYSTAEGMFCVIHYKYLTPSTVSVAGAYNADDPDFGANDTGGKATQAEAEEAYTVGNGYFEAYSLLTKPLVDGVWRNGELTNSMRSAEYTFEVESGKTYYVWWNSSAYGPTPKDKTMSVRGSAKYSGETNYIFGTSAEGIYANWVNPQLFTADRNGSVTVIITPFSEYSENGTFAVAFSTVSLRPGAAIAKTITAGQWADDTIATDEVHVYTMSVTAGTVYYVWWNERGNGDGTKSANVQVQARYADDTLIFNEASGYAGQWVASAWDTPRSFTPGISGIVDLRVRPYDGSIAYPGTYGIVYSTINARPLKDSATLISVTRNGPSGTPTTALTLTFDKPVVGLSASDITLSTPTNATFGVSKGTLSGEGSIYTLGVSSPFDVTVTVTVGNDLFQITDPSKQVDIYGDVSIATPLLENLWADGNLQDLNVLDWYKITVSAGTTYYVWWNDSANGDDSKTADVAVGAWKADGTNIFGSSNTTVDHGWSGSSVPQTIPPSATDSTVYVRVRSWGGTNSNYLGTYGVVYSSVNSRPAVRYPDDIPVTFNSVSANGESGTATTELTLVFSEAIANLSAADITLNMNGPFSFTKGTLSGNGPSYTLGVSSAMDGTLIVKVEKKGYYITGSPQTVDIHGSGSIAINPLVEGVWTDGELLSGSSVDWYTITASVGKTYRIWWNDENAGDGSKEADVVVGAWRANGTNIFGGSITSVDSGWSTAQSFTVTENGTVYVRVMPYNTNNTFAGTYGIVFTADNATRPAIPPVEP
jgi:hypothetical protein